MALRKNKTGSNFSVKAACQRLGIGPHTLRAWESRYGAVEPERTAKGQRLYSESDLHRLEYVVRLVNLGHSVGIVARLSEAELLRLLRKTSEPQDALQAVEQRLSPFFEVLEHDLKRFDIHGVSSLLDHKRSALGARVFVLEILAPLMRWVGSKIDKKDFCVAHEHALSAVVRDQIYQTLRYGSAPVVGPKSRCFVLATPEDDLHEFGILMSATLLSHYGLRSHFLGANLPAEPLAIAMKAVRGDILILGNAPVPETERRIPFDEYLRHLHRALPKGVAIWIGGGGAVPHLRSVLPGREHRFIGSLLELDSLLSKQAELGKVV